MAEKKKLSLAAQIFIGLIGGIILGLCLMGHPDIATSYIKPFGTIFLNLLKFIVVPIVLFSITCGVMSMSDIKKIGSIGVKTVVYFLCTTAFAVIIGLLFANIFKGTFTTLSTADLSYEVKQTSTITDTLVNIFPSNIAAPLVNANMLQVIVIAILFGVGIVIAGEKGKAAAKVIESFNDVSMQIMDFILKLSPIGVFCMMTPVVAENGPKVLGSLAMVLLTAYVAYIVHIVLVYSATVKGLSGMSPLKFFKGIAPAMVFAFSSASSVGTIPINLDCVEKLGVRKDIGSFVLPLGATINMDGTAIYQGVCAVFIASCYGINLTASQMLTIVLTATLASIGTAGVPGSGMVMLSMVLGSVGLPIEGIALVAGIDRIFDMGRTVVNITGDSACAIIVSKMEEKKEKKALAETH